MAQSTMLWTTYGAAVGICPGFDDFLIWLDPDHDYALKAPITEEVLADFTDTIVPLITEHRLVSERAELDYDKAEQAWAFDIVRGVAIEGRIKTRNDMPKRPQFDSFLTTNHVLDAYNAAVESLRSFAERHGAKSEGL